MRHNQKKKHLGRSTSHRKAMMANLVTSLFENGRIQTTQAKANVGRQLAERMITFAKRGDLHARRQVLKVVRDKTVVKKLFDVIGPRFAERNGGYTRILKLSPRLGDRAPMVIFELLGEPVASKSKDEKKKKEKPGEVKKADKQVSDKKKAKIRPKKRKTKSKEEASDQSPAEEKSGATKGSVKKPTNG